MKYLKNLPNHDAYEAFINGNQYKEIQQEKNEAISYCQAEQHVHYNPYIPPTPKILDILYSDNNGNLSFTSDVLPSVIGKTPIALCIAGQEFFGINERARWMSLKYMNYETPDTGSLTSQHIYWGNYGTDISTITNISSTYHGGPDSGYITVDYYDNTSQSNKLPNIFDLNNEWNISALGAVNTYAMTDINGKNKTNKIVTTATAQSTWETDSTISNNSGNNYAPAACCCARYHTLGTQAGDWYLGACGEMSMILAQKTAINNKLSAIAAIYPNNCISLLGNISYWTATESSGYGTYYINTTNGLIDKYIKNSNYNAIAILQY